MTQAEVKAPLENDDHNQKLGFGQRMRNLADNTALHGVPRVFSSTRWFQKVIWLLLFITVFVLLVMQLNDLYKEFSSNPIKTTIQLKYQPQMLFPAITLCNLNPIRRSQVRENVSRTLFDLVNSKMGAEVEKTTRQKREASNVSDSDGQTSDEFVKIGNMPMDAWYQLKQDIILEFASLEVEDRKSVGHQLHDFIAFCTVAGKECLEESYSSILTNLYGNCYTVQSHAYTAAESGPIHGISMTINLENFEFIEKYRRGYGARMIIHDQNSVPLPEEDGITLSAGYETTIGLKMLRIERVGEPYGSCQDVKGFQDKYGLKYTRQICMLICEKEAILKACHCVLTDMYIDILWDKVPQFYSANSCYDNSSMYNCSQMVKSEFVKGNFTCGCQNPCSETIYQTTFSGRLWPTEKFTHTLKSDVCNKIYISEKCQLECSGARKVCSDDCPDCPLNQLDNTTISMNFLKILVYFQDLNYETISESPLYETTRFLSDIGGTMGLFLGASVLGMCEVLDVIIEVVMWLKDVIPRRRVGDTIAKETK